jgi:putative ABC transport system substrate-binding protein
MDRRTFVVLITYGLLVARRVAGAQQSAKVWRLGFLDASSRRTRDEAGSAGAFLQGMHELGYIEGQNLHIEWRYADGNYDILPKFAAELVSLSVDVIVAVPSPAIRAAKQATTTIPIVFPSTGDPVGNGFAASLAHPGGNLTGLSNSNLDVSAKTVELLRTILPKMSRIAVLGNPGSSTESAIMKSVRAAAQSVDVQVITVEAHTPAALDAGFAQMKRERVDAVIVAADALMGMQRKQIADLALQFRLPSVTQGVAYAKVGGLMAYGQDTTESWQRAASYVDRILKGAKPGDLPIEQPTKLRLVINMKTAKMLGLKIPQSLLARADEVIQ